MGNLQDATDYKVMSFKEAAESLGWCITDDGEYYTVKCNCSESKIQYSGFIGTEIVRCENCEKEMTDLFSPIRTGNSTCTVLDYSKFEIEKDIDGNEKYWIADDRKGGIKIKR